jgi:HPt (histidine-containing phosphotransfer) domain-containing protein
MSESQTINRATIAQLRAITRPGSTSLLERVVQLFNRESADLLVTLDQAIDRRQAGKIRAAAHKFRSVSGNAGADLLAARCLDLELSSHDGTHERWVELMTAIRDEHAEATVALLAELDAKMEA